MNRTISVRFLAAATIVSLLMSAFPAAFFVAEAQEQAVSRGGADKVNVCIANQGVGNFAPGVKSVSENAIQEGLANSGVNYDIVEDGQNWDFVYPNGFTGQEIFEADCNAVISESISGTKYNDDNNDGQTDGEDGIEDWEIRLYKVENEWTLVDSVLTDENGEYDFGELSEGTYKVCELLPEGWTQTFVSNGSTNESPNVSEEGPECRTVNVDKLSGSNTVNFGNYYDEPADFCDPSQKPGGMSIAQWHEENQFDGSSCFTYEEVAEQCGTFDVNFTANETELGFGFNYVLGSEVPDNFEDGNEFPATFTEDENGGSVELTYYVVGPEKDYFVGSDVPNFWDGTGTTVTVNTDCENDEPPVEIPGRCSVKIDEFQVPANSAAGSDTNVSLDNGGEYFALVEGTYTFGAPKNGDERLADAEYSLDAGATEWVKEFANDRPDVLDLFIDGANPDFGAFRPDHTYGTLFMGTGAVSNFAIEDSPYNDNSGALDVTIYECAPEEPPRCENLLTNGSFEEPVVKDAKLWDKFLEAATGWVTEKVADDSATTLEIHRNWSSNDAAEGEQYAELDGDHSTKVSQTVTTIPGAEYELKWAFAPRHDIDGEQNQLSVLLNDSVVAAEGPATGSAGLEAADWTLNSHTFTADGESTTITFADGGPSNTFGTFLDDAQLCLVSEPEPCHLPYLVTFGAESDDDTYSTSAADGLVIEEVADGYQIGLYDDGRDGVYRVQGTITFPVGIDTSTFTVTEGSGSDGLEGILFNYPDTVNFVGNTIEFDLFVNGANDIFTITDESLESTENCDLEAPEPESEVYSCEAGMLFLDTETDAPETMSLYTVNDTDGVATFWAEYDIDLHSALAIADDETVYAIEKGTGDLVTLDDDAGNITVVGGTGLDAEKPVAMEIAPDGTLYVMTQESDKLYKIDMTDGSATEVADLDLNVEGGDIVFDSGLIYYIKNTGEVYVIDPADSYSEDLVGTLSVGNERITSAATKDGTHYALTRQDSMHPFTLNPFVEAAAVAQTGPYAWGDGSYCPAEEVVEPVACTLEAYSDTNTVVMESNMFATEAYEHDSWADEFEAAQWIWGSEYVEDPTEQATSTFKETFTVDNPSAASLVISADNWYKVYVNGTLVVDRAGQNSYQEFQQKTYEAEIMAELVSGENTLLIEVINEPLSGSTKLTNPAGLLYKLTVEGDPASCELTTKPSSLDITSPDTDGQVLSGTYDFTANYQDADNDEDEVFWAIRAGSCSGEDMVGNAPASPFHPSTFDAVTGEFETTVDMSTWDNGEYCLVVNPREDAGAFNERETRTFTLENPIKKPDTYTISGVKWEDENGNGLIEDEEPTLSGWTIFLSEVGSEGEPLATTTDDNGSYTFEVPAGTWVVTEETVSGWNQTGQYENGQTVPVDSDAFGACQLTIPGDGESQDIYTCSFGNQEDDQTITTTTNNDSGSRNSSSGTRIERVAQPQPLVLGESVSRCEFLNDHMQMGAANDRFEVMKLQMFMKMIMGYDQPVTGFFGTITDENVKRFQEEYRHDILDPWYVQDIVPNTEPTGFVYKLTKWKINDIVCPGWDPYPSFEGEDLTENVDLDVAPIPD